MVFGSEKARANFLKYAFTSVDKEHVIHGGYRREVLTDLRSGVPIENIEEDLFLTGVINMEKFYGKRATEKDVDNYFLGIHNKFSDCKACVGTVTNVNKKSARVDTPYGNCRYDTFLTSDLKPGSKVIVHGRYVIKGLK
jgi:hypothetical protein